MQSTYHKALVPGLYLRSCEVGIVDEKRHVLFGEFLAAGVTHVAWHSPALQPVLQQYSASVPLSVRLRTTRQREYP